MSERKDEQWLDDQLRQVVNGAKPVLDAEQWKRKYSKEYQTLLSRSRESGQPNTGASRIVRWVLESSIRRFAVAAVVVGVVGVLLIGRLGPDTQRPVTGSSSIAQSPDKMMTMMSLQAAYRQGGTEALDRQFDQALRMLGPRTTSMSLKELLEG